ncbi:MULTISPECIES: hypothetical protein [Bacillus]|uniref:hypothetical protein n=1 Tax=Bacillus TaxID=1386 RepID=UPI000BEBFB94|nr:hypothetical protein [Bacillus cereus]PEC81610.1 hypothetical protein CON08_00455 [Bacillus cereus]
MIRHYLINTLVNWRESLRKSEIQKAYNDMRYMGMSKLEIRRLINLFGNMGYKWYEYRHPKLCELLGK